MKIGAKIVLLIFFLFLSLPTAISIINKDTDVSMCYNMTEEELLLKSFNEIQAALPQEFSYHHVQNDFVVVKQAVSEHLEKPHNHQTEEIFLPPPEIL